MDKVRSIILFAGSDGSSWFSDLISQHPRAYHVCFEPLQEENGLSEETRARWVRECFAGKPAKGESCISLPAGAPSEEEFATKWRGCGLVFFKARHYEIPQEVLPDLMQKFGTRCIFLVRRNKIKQAVSHLRRTVHGISHFEHNYLQPAVSLDPCAILEWARVFVDHEERTRRMLEDVGLIHHVVYYEELLISTEPVLRAVFGFLGLDPSQMSLESWYGKITSDDLKAAIENYDVVRSFFEGSVFEKDFS